MPHKWQSRMLLVNAEERLDMLDKWRAVEKKQIRGQILLHSTVCFFKTKTMVKRSKFGSVNLS